MAEAVTNYQAANLDNGVAPAQPQWYQGAEVLKETDPEIWQSFENGVKSGSIKDLPSLIKKGISAEKRLGQSITPLPKDAKPEDRAQFNKRLQDMGILPQIPATPNDYQLNLDAIPENLRMDDLITEFKTFAHQNGISAEVANKLLELNAKQFTAASQLFEGDRAAAETRIGELLKAEGRTLDDSFFENGHRAAEHFLKNSPQTLEKVNRFFGNDPDVMYFFSKMGEALGEDTSQLGETSNQTDTAFDEIQKIMTDPKHPEHELWLKENGHGPVTEKIQKAYARKFPGTVNLS